MKGKKIAATFLAGLTVGAVALTGTGCDMLADLFGIGELKSEKVANEEAWDAAFADIDLTTFYLKQDVKGTIMDDSSSEEMSAVSEILLMENFVYMAYTENGEFDGICARNKDGLVNACYYQDNAWSNWYSDEDVTWEDTISRALENVAFIPSNNLFEYADFSYDEEEKVYVSNESYMEGDEELKDVKCRLWIIDGKFYQMQIVGKMGDIYEISDINAEITLRLGDVEEDLIEGSVPQFEE